MFGRKLILAAALLAGTSLGALSQTVTPLPNPTRGKERRRSDPRANLGAEGSNRYR
jgi:hypothetical protein